MERNNTESSKNIEADGEATKSPTDRASSSITRNQKQGEVNLLAVTGGVVPTTSIDNSCRSEDATNKDRKDRCAAHKWTKEINLVVDLKKVIPDRNGEVNDQQQQPQGEPRSSHSDPPSLQHMAEVGQHPTAKGTMDNSHSDPKLLKAHCSKSVNSAAMEPATNTSSCSSKPNTSSGTTTRGSGAWATAARVMKLFTVGTTTDFSSRATTTIFSSKSQMPPIETKFSSDTSSSQVTCPNDRMVDDEPTRGIADSDTNNEKSANFGKTVSSPLHEFANGSEKHVVVKKIEDSNSKEDPPDALAKCQENRSHKRKVRTNNHHGHLSDTSSSAAAARSFLPRDAKAKALSDIDGDSLLLGAMSGRANHGSEIESSPSGLDIAIVSRLDDSAYDRSLMLDAVHLFTDFVFPDAFPWHDPKIVLEMTTPFDIEDLPAVIHATSDSAGKLSDSSEHRSQWQQYQERLLSLGFGRFETGRSRRPCGRKHNCRKTQASPRYVNCVARRGESPGVIDFAVALSPPAVRSEEADLAEFFESVSTLPWTAPWETPNPVARWKRFRSMEEYMEQGITVKRFKISVRVDGVSSRSTLFPNPPSGSPRQLLFATFPPSIAVGKPVLNQTDMSAAAAALGSYDVKHPLMQGNKKAKGNAGRGRLIWSEPSFGGQGGVSYKSILSCQLMESSQGYKRPRQASVGIRLKGVLLFEDDKVEKGSHERDDDKEAINSFDWSNAACTLDHKNYIGALWKTPKRLSDPELLGSKDDGDILVKYTPPTLISLPCNEGFVRVVCLKLGILQGINTHEMLVNATKRVNKSKDNVSGSSICSVCWIGSSIGRKLLHQVFNCIDCALPVHLECCLDRGVFVDKQSRVWRCAVCADYHTTKTMEVVDPQVESVEKVKPECEEDVMETSGCVRCPLKDEKPRRRSKVPGRYDNNALSTYRSNRKSSLRNGVDSAEIPPAESCDQPSPEIDIAKGKYMRPSHKCSLCPHLGGAMSRMKTASKDSESRWAHEICRVWSQPSDTDTSSHLRLSSIYQAESSCVICGKGHIDDFKPVKQEDCTVGGATAVSSEGLGVDVGLTKCAAKGCNLFFHPMCATLISRVTTLPEASAGERKKSLSLESNARQSCNNAMDAELAAQFTFHFLRGIREETTIQSPGGKDPDSIIPVAFCGWHNPQRAPSLFGCPPFISGIQPNHMLNWIKIPPCLTEVNPNEETIIPKGKAKTSKAK